MRILLIKTSSMGDVIHTLPALTDAASAIPGIYFNWVVEENFAEIPGWHPAVAKVIPVAIRRWRKNLWRTLTGGEWGEFKRTLRSERYDCVIDAQGLVKSAFLTRGVRAPVYGFDQQSAREPLASRFYHTRLSVPKAMHAVERTRSLFAQALGYSLPAQKGRYQLDMRRISPTPQDFALIKTLKPFMMFLHGTTRADKHWPEPYWLALAKLMVGQGYNVCLPWGNPVELQRANRIAAAVDGVTVLPSMCLQQLAAVLQAAAGVVAVDTGLGHLAAALDKPTVSLYGPTSPELVGAYGENQRHLLAADFTSGFPLPEPEPAATAISRQAAIVEPAVFAHLTPDTVFSNVLEMVGTGVRS